MLKFSMSPTTEKRGLDALGQFSPKHQQVIEAVQSAIPETRTPAEVASGRQRLLDQAKAATKPHP